MNDAGHLRLRLRLPLVRGGTAHLLLGHLQEVGLVEPHPLAADGHPVRLAQPLGLGLSQRQQAGQVAQRVAAVAAAVPVAVQE